MNFARLLIVGFILVLVSGLNACGQNNRSLATKAGTPVAPKKKMETPLNKSEEEWKKTLTPEQYHVIREKGTEAPYTGKFWNSKEEGVYTCAGCGTELFTSSEKYDSGCGWPSFYDAMDKKKIITAPDYKLSRERIEIMCANCGGHLGHVFDDGPQPTGLRYCVNSVSLDFKKVKVGK